VTLRKIPLAVALAALCLVAVTACNRSGNSNGQALENQQQYNNESTFEQVQPLPHFPYSQYRATLTEVEAIQALGTQTTSFFFNQGVQKPIFACPSLGMPVASTAQLSNPSQPFNMTDGNGNYNTVVLGNMDPNGTYSPPDSTGTNVVCLNATGQPYIEYWEGFVDAVSGAAHWDSATNSVVVTGAPALPKCKPATATVAGKRQRVTTCAKA
jgi:hypothetical protein